MDRKVFLYGERVGGSSSKQGKYMLLRKFSQGRLMWTLCEREVIGMSHTDTGGKGFLEKGVSNVKCT